MKILGIETSTRACSVALSEDGTILATEDSGGSFRPSDQLMGQIESCLKVAKITAKDLDGIAVSAGPGSFTGLRVGITAAKTLGFALSKPVASVSSLDVLAANAPKQELPLWVLVDARKGKLYAACYQAAANGLPQRVGPEQLVEPEQFVKQLEGASVMLGDGLTRYGDRIQQAMKNKATFLKQETWVPKASFVCQLGQGVLSEGKVVDPHQLTPRYLYSKESDMTGW